jgi:hypothetical protein
VSTTNHPCASATELPALQETAARLAADHARQLERLRRLRDAFERQRLELSPAGYATQCAEIEQQTLIVQAAEQANAAAAHELSIAHLEYDKEQAQAARAQRLREIDTALTAATDEINLLQALLASVPERLSRARQVHSSLLRERAQVTTNSWENQ